MAKPWEKYSTPSTTEAPAGPWAKYAAPAEQPVEATGLDKAVRVSEAVMRPLNAVGDFVGNVAAKGQEMIAQNPVASGLQTAYNMSPTGLLMNQGGKILSGINRGAQVLGEKTAEAGFPGIGTGIAMAPAALTALAPIPNGKLNMLQKAGGQGINSAIKLKPRTLEILSKGENPATFGAKLGKRLNEEGAIGMSAETTFDKVKGLKNQFGKSVDSALKQIKKAGHPVEIEAQSALQPLLDEANRLKSATLSATKQTAKPFEQVYTSLLEKTKATGKLSLDNVRAAMQETGEALNNAAFGSTKEVAYSKLYAKLAQMREQIVNAVASGVKNPKLATNLKTANEGYSTYTTILDDMSSAAAQEGAGKTAGMSRVELTKPGTWLPRSAPTIGSKALLRLGNNAAALGKYPGALAVPTQRLSQPPFINKDK